MKRILGLLDSLQPRTGEVARFVLAGAANTGVTYLLYQALLAWIRYEFAYAIAYVIGIGISYIVNSIFVFRQPLAWRAAMAFPLVYAVQLVLGSAMLKVLVDGLRVAEQYAPLLVVALMLPITFLLSRKLVVGKKESSKPPA